MTRTKENLMIVGGYVLAILVGVIAENKLHLVSKVVPGSSGQLQQVS